MNTFRWETFDLSPGFIALLANQLEKLTLEPHQVPIVRHLMQGKSIFEVAVITGASPWDVMKSVADLASQVYRPQPPDAPQTVSPPGRPPRRPLSAAAKLVFSEEAAVRLVPSVHEAAERSGKHVCS